LAGSPLAIAALGCVFSGAALAQETLAANDVLGTVVVTADRRQPHRVVLVQDQSRPHVDVHRLRAPFEFPSIESAVRQSHPDRSMLCEVFRRLRLAVPGEVVGRSCNHHAKVATDRHGDHVLRRRLGQANAGIESVGNDVDHARLGDDVYFDLWVAAQVFAEKTNRIPYAASKAALVSMSENLAVYLLPKGIRVSCLCPGPTMTTSTVGMKPWSENVVMRGPGRHFPVRSAEHAATALADGMCAGRVIIPTHEDGLDVVRRRGAR
jgi:hypothetical protein